VCRVRCLPSRARAGAAVLATSGLTLALTGCGAAAATLTPAKQVPLIIYAAEGSGNTGAGRARSPGGPVTPPTFPGQQQRLALARALVAGMPWLLCDQPISTPGADPREQIRVGIVTVSRDSGATVMYSTHEQPEAFAQADQLAVIKDGRICQMASPEDVQGHRADLFVAQFSGLSAHLSGKGVGPAGARLCRVGTGSTDVVATTVQPPIPRTQVSLLLRPDALSICSSERTDGIL